LAVFHAQMHYVPWRRGDFFVDPGEGGGGRLLPVVVVVVGAVVTNMRDPHHFRPDRFSITQDAAQIKKNNTWPG